jgi:hypothetical protein
VDMGLTAICDPVFIKVVLHCLPLPN